MNRIVLIILILAGNVFASFAHAQGTLYLSNLGQTSTASIAVGSDFWIGQGFTTGTNSGGYILNSVQLLMNASSGNPAGLTVSIYSNNGLYPGTIFGSLTGSDPSTAGLYDYTASDIFLSASTLYYIVLTSTTPTAQGAFNWSGYNGFTNRTPTTDNNWILPDSYDTSADGLNWTWVPRQNNFQFAIYATPVPEPSSLALLGLSLVSFGLWRRQKTAGLRNRSGNFFRRDNFSSRRAFL